MDGPNRVRPPFLILDWVIRALRGSCHWRMT